MRLPGELHGSDEHADAQAHHQRVEDHLGGDHEPGGLAGRRDVPVPTVLNVVTVRCRHRSG